MNQPLVLLRSQINQVHTIPFYFSKICFHIILPCPHWSSKLYLAFTFTHKIHPSSPPYEPHVPLISSSLLSSHEYYMVDSPDHEALHYDVRSPQFPAYIITLRLKYLPQHPTLEHPRPMNFPQFETKTTCRRTVVHVLVCMLLESKWEDKGLWTER